MAVYFSAKEQRATSIPAIAVVDVDQCPRQDECLDGECLDEEECLDEASTEEIEQLPENDQPQYGEEALVMAKEGSPIKEALLTRFAKFAPSPVSSSPSTDGISINTDTSAPISTGTEECLASSLPSNSSWLNQVRGRIAKTVEEKYSEYKLEREHRRAVLKRLDEQKEPEALHESHSFCTQMAEEEPDSGSYSSLPDHLSLVLQSRDVVIDDLVAHVTPNQPPKLSRDKIDSNAFSEISTSSEERAQQRSVSTRGKFSFNFLDRRRSSQKPSSEQKPSNENKTNVEGNKSVNCNADLTEESTGMVQRSNSSLSSASLQSSSSASTTPTGTRATLRSRVLGLVNRSNAASSSTVSTPTTTQSRREGLRLPLTYSATPTMHVESSPEVHRGTTKDLEADQSVETAIEADEALNFFDESNDTEDDKDSNNNKEKGHKSEKKTYTKNNKETTEDILDCSRLWFYLSALPPLLMLLVQLLPLPNWLIGFMTGCLFSGLVAVYVGLRMIGDDKPSVGFVVKDARSSDKPILVQEELQRTFMWLNLWPPKNGPYDSLTYDVRRTMSVRAMVHGPWLEMRFPKRNLPLRKMHNENEPDDVVFIDHKEVIDLTHCVVDLIPENLPAKRIWSKKYPIRIRTNLKKIAAKTGSAKTPTSNLLDVTKRLRPKSNESHDACEANNTLNEAKASNEGGNVEVKRSSSSSEMAVKLSELEVALDQDPLFGLESPTEAFKSTNDEKPSTSTKDEDLVKSRSVNNCLYDATSDNDPKSVESELKNDDDVSSLGDDDVDSFVVVPEDEQQTFHLFARTSREKEAFFYTLAEAASFMRDWNLHQTNDEESTKESETRATPCQEHTTFKMREQGFKAFMEGYFQAQSEATAREQHESIRVDSKKAALAREQLAFVNIFAARIWHDLYKKNAFVDLLRDKITRKLLKVKIAQYFTDVQVTTLDLGSRLPQVLNASLPWQDALGLWVDLEVQYEGSLCQATVETKGIRLPKDILVDKEAQELILNRPAATLDSEEEDSAEEDDDMPDLPENDLCLSVGVNEQQTHGGGLRARVLEGLLRSEFVTKMAESEWVKKNITGKNITLQLQLHSLRGKLTLNVPPPPSDRLWYSFREPPELEIALRPLIDGKGLAAKRYESTFTAIMKQIEKRLKQEFMKVLVHPNMEDEIVPFLDHINYVI